MRIFRHTFFGTRDPAYKLCELLESAVFLLGISQNWLYRTHTIPYHTIPYLQYHTIPTVYLSTCINLYRGAFLAAQHSYWLIIIRFSNCANVSEMTAVITIKNSEIRVPVYHHIARANTYPKFLHLNIFFIIRTYKGGNGQKRDTDFYTHTHTHTHTSPMLKKKKKKTID